MIFLTEEAATMNVTAGFEDGFSFFYTAFVGATVRIYDGLNGTGTSSSRASPDRSISAAPPTSSYSMTSLLAPRFRVKPQFRNR